RRLRGGKGVATGGGAFAVLSPIVFISGVALWLAVSRLTKLASLASILAVAVLPIGMVVVGRDLWEVLTTIGLCAIVMSRHIGNMRRLVTATEHRI
ncbi:MAG: glycerol-3-phosphate acyltransferase, partial [Ilumatobacter sp.]